MFDDVGDFGVAVHAGAATPFLEGYFLRRRNKARRLNDVGDFGVAIRRAVLKIFDRPC
jgi:hypothetical protein